MAPLAHTGLGGGADKVTSVLVATSIGATFWLMHLRRATGLTKRTLRWTLPLVAVGAIVAAVAIGVTSGGSGARPVRVRPVSTARVQILAPVPDQSIVGTTTDLVIRVVGGRIVPPSQVSGALRPDEGHLHVFVDGQLISMTSGLRQQLSNLPGGPHLVRVEFVARDHGSFRTPVVAAVAFRSTPP